MIRDMRFDFNLYCSVSSSFPAETVGLMTWVRCFYNASPECSSPYQISPLTYTSLLLEMMILSFLNIYAYGYFGGKIDDVHYFI